MKTKRQDFLYIAGFCILLILAASTAGCTGPGAGTPGAVTTPAQTAPPDTATTPAQTLSLATAASPVPTVIQTSVTAAQSPDPVILTINSAKKQTKVYTMIPKPGRIFLVLDMTIQNNAVVKGLDLTDASITLAYARAGTSPEISITSQVRGGLDNPLVMPTKIEQNDKRTGQVVFGVLDNSNTYTIKLLGSDGAVVASSAQFTVNA